MPRGLILEVFSPKVSSYKKYAQFLEIHKHGMAILIL